MRRPPDQAGARKPRWPLPVRSGGAARGRRLEALGLLACALSAGLAALAAALALGLPGGARRLTVQLLPLAALPLTLPARAACRRHLARLRAGRANQQGMDRVRAAARLFRWALAATAAGCAAVALARALLLVRG
jgi:hypothetical protein